MFYWPVLWRFIWKFTADLFMLPLNLPRNPTREMKLQLVLGFVSRCEGRNGLYQGMGVEEGDGIIIKLQFNRR